jgi:type IV pilus assembly protein PilV
MKTDVLSQRGVTLIEILVTVLIIAFGVLGLIGMNVKVQNAQMDSYQRAQAILLVQDMAGRIIANKTNALNYVTASALGTGDSQPASCSGLSGVSLDQCEWSNALKGAGERTTSGADCSASPASCIGAMVGARGCVSRISTNPSVYQVTVAWQGTTDLVAPSLTCGSGSYTRETLRRAISAQVPLACLTAPTTACTTF